MKRIISFSFISFLILSLFSCSFSAQTRKVYQGPVKNPDEVSKFFMKGNGFIERKLYKIDGQTNSDFSQNYNIDYTNMAGCFTVELLPGEHTFEMIAFDSQNAKYAYNLKFNMEKGKAYEYKEEKNSYIVLKEDDNRKINLKEEKIPFFKEQEENQPHGLLIQDDKTKTYGNFSILRIDNFPGQNIPTIGGYNLFVGLDDYQIRLSPGKHKIEFITSITVGERFYFSQIVTQLEVNIIKEKKYKMVVLNKEDLTTFSNAKFALVEYE